MLSVITYLDRFITNPQIRFEYLSRLGIYNNMTDEKYIKKEFGKKMGYKLDLENPQTFNEKIQWLKLYDRKSEYTLMVDKYAVKKYVANKIGEKYVIPTFGLWDRPEDIEYDLLPDQFVLKVTHDSGGLVICRDKSQLNIKAVSQKLSRSLKRNYYFMHREWPYKNVPRKILAEKYLKDESSKHLIDYKFYCFEGEPKFLYISEGLENHKTARISFVDMKWKQADFGRSDYKPFDKIPEKPDKFDEMCLIAKTLSSGKKFLRVDLYQVNGQIYFGELTFSPCAGYMPFQPFSADRDLGKLIVLPSNRETYSHKTM